MRDALRSTRMVVMEAGPQADVPRDADPGVVVAPRLRGERGRFLRGPRSRGGAPKGNLNAVKRPWVTYWRRRALRREDRWIVPLLQDYAGSLVADRGGADAMTAGEAHMIELAMLARGCTLLALDAAAKAGGITAPMRSAATRRDAVV